MAKRYRIDSGTRAVNWVFRRLTELGLGASYRYILTVRGRKTGVEHSTPVDVMEHDGRRWLVAGYGPVNWVQNARAAGEVTLRRGRHSTRYAVRDAETSDAVPVLRKYMAEVRVTRSYFDATSTSPDAAIAAELERHPVLELSGLGAR